MPLIHDITLERRNRSIPYHFRAGDLMTRLDGEARYRIGNGTYAQNTIRPYIADRSIDPVGGTEPRAGQAFFVRMGRGLYRLREDPNENEDNEQQANTQLDEPADEELAVPVVESAEDEVARQKISSLFVDYIEQKPFRIMKSGTWYPIAGSVSSWQQRLLNYAWYGGNRPPAPPNWDETSQDLDGFARRISGLLSEDDPDQQEVEAWFTAVRTWGGIGTGNIPSGDKILDNIRSVLEKQVEDCPLNSTWTKIYAISAPDEFAIYDSRVATAILSIAEDVFRRPTSGNEETNLCEFRRTYRYLGHFDGVSRGGTRDRGRRYKGWPRANGNWGAQLDANSLCKGIRDTLNQKSIGGRSDWSLREVEAVLFMEGY